MFEYEEFFIKVLEFIFENHEQWPRLKRLGISANGFPKNLFQIISTFEKVAENNSTLAAKMKIVKHLENLPKTRKLITIEEIAEKYQDYSKIVKGLELANEINSDPKNAELIISKWKKNISSSVELIDFHKSIESTIKSNEEKLKLGKTIIKIPEWSLVSEMIGGFNPGRLIVLSARTGIGKTNLALNLGIKAAKEFPVLFFNMEMITEDIFSRMIKSIARISSNEWNNGTYIETKKIERIAQIYSGEMNNKFLVSNGKAQSINEITSTIVKQNDEHNLGLVIIDYDQKIKTDEKYSGEQWQQLQKAAEELEEVAKYCNLPVLLLAQANEEGNIKASQRIEQSAATHLNFYYDESEASYVLEAKKNRFGKPNAKVKVIYHPEMSYCEERSFDNVLPKPNEENGKRRKLQKSIL